MKIKINKKIAAAAIGLGVFLISAELVYSGVMQVFQLKLADSLYVGANTEKVDTDIVIIQIDDKALEQVNGLGHFSLWNRSFFAKALKNINKHNPKLVAFDIFFKLPKDQQTDQQFADALKETKQPVLIYRDNPKIFTHGYFGSDEVVAKPLAILTQNGSTNLAVSNVLPDSDNVVRKLLPGIFNKIENNFGESFAFSVSRLVREEEKMPFNWENFNIGNNILKYKTTAKNNKTVAVPLESGQMLINYFSSPEKIPPLFPKISFIDVYNENYAGFDAEKLFKNKIVLIGASAPYFNDSYITPASSQVMMSGVEIHANAIETILERKFLRNEMLAEKIIVLFLLCAGAAFVFMYGRIRWSLLFLVAVSAVYALAAPAFFKNGLILDLVHPYLILPTVFIASYTYRYVTEFKEKLMLKNAFGHYVNPKIADIILAHPENLKLGGEKCEVTVLFTDIAHFTSIAESLKAESLVALLNEYFGEMSQVILEECGTLDKFEGDAIMAFFGAPLSQPDHALKACRTALKMRLKLQAWAESWKQNPLLPGGESRPAIDFRCGISTGEVIVGNMGSADRFDYTVMGDAVNLGSRLEGANKKYETRTMISETTHKLVKNDFETRELDTIRVVGKNKPIKVYELLAPKNELPPAALQLLQSYNEGIQLYHERKFTEALAKFEQILKTYPDDGPSKLYRQRCEVLRDFPPSADWDGIFEMRSK